MSNHINLIEDYLDINHVEYQSIQNNIEIYSLENDLILICINKDRILIKTKEQECSFYDVNNDFFEQLGKLIF